MTDASTAAAAMQCDLPSSVTCPAIYRSNLQQEPMPLQCSIIADASPRQSASYSQAPCNSRQIAGSLISQVTTCDSQMTAYAQDMLRCVMRMQSALSSLLIGKPALHQ